MLEACEVEQKFWADEFRVRLKAGMGLSGRWNAWEANLEGAAAKKSNDILNHGADIVRNFVWKVVFWAVNV